MSPPVVCVLEVEFIVATMVALEDEFESVAAVEDESPNLPKIPPTCCFPVMLPAVEMFVAIQVSQSPAMPPENAFALEMLSPVAEMFETVTAAPIVPLCEPKRLPTL